MNTDAPWPTLSVEEAEARVLGIQTKLHHWATDDPGRRFDDLFNLVCDPAFLLVAWRRVKGNKGARTAGVDGRTAFYVSAVRGEEGFLADLRVELKAGRFRPLPARERLIPKPGGSKRRLGIPTVTDRVVQAALKLVLEPIFEADFQPCSYGFRPGRRAQDAIAEIHHLTSRPAGYEWVLEGDITACFDTIDHTALFQRVRRRIADRRVLALIKAFCKGGILTQDGATQDTITGTPQGGILSPLLANIALSVLDEHFTAAWEGLVRPGRARSARARAWRPGGWSATPTTSSCWSKGPGHTPRRYARRPPRCWPRWGLACRRPRRGSPISTRGSTSWASASSGGAGRARPSGTSTPIRPCATRRH